MNEYGTVLVSRVAGMATLERALLACAFAGLACAGTARAGGPPFEACTLLTAADVERVQGGSLREAISSGSAAESVATTQCFFRVDPLSSSVSLPLPRAGRGRPDRRELRERWERLLHPRERHGQGSERERDPGEKEPRA